MHFINSGRRKLTRQIWLAMRFTIVLLTAAALHVSATGNSQTVQLTGKNLSLKKVFNTIKNQTGYVFFYDAKLLREAKPVTVELINSSLDKALVEIFEGQPFTWIMVDKTITVAKRKEPVLSEKPVQPEQPDLPPLDIKGVVRDEDGNPLSDASVKLKGTERGTVTNSDGSFSLQIPDGKGVLLISYVGHLTIELPVTKSGELNIVLKKAENKVDEVVVIGYGAVKRKDVTGAISSVKANVIPKSANTSIDQALSGRAAGLTTVQSSGQPGAGVSVQIRGNASFASTGVLYVVDGVPINGGAGEPGSGNRYGGIDRSPLNFLNPDDIESVEVLKDASAAAIYGARAGAGVILITTKRGKSGEARLNYGFSHAFQQAADFYEILNQRDYMVERNRITKEKWMLDRAIAPYGTTDPSSVPAFVPKYSDAEINASGKGENALDRITQNGFVQQHNLSIAGGTAKTKYYVSGNYLDQDGVIKTSGFKRYSGRINLDQMVGERLKIGVNMTGSKSFSDNPAIGTGQFENSGIILSAFYHPPTVPLIAADGSYPLNPDYTNSPNPLSFFETTDKTVQNRILTSAFAELEIIENLKARANFSYDQSNSKRSTYLPKSFLYGDRTGGQANISENTSNISLLEYTLGYTRNFKNTHHLDALVGYSYQVLSSEGFSAGNQQFLTDNFLYHSLGVGEFARPSVGSYRSEQVWASYFARARYDYKNKYLLQASLRRDGASNFAKNKKYGLFPSVSAGWKISNEPFMQSIRAISFLKLRASYGSTGNSNIGNTTAFAAYQAGSNYVFGNTQQVGVYQSRLDNPDLSWETAREINLGLDFGLFNDRISGSFEVFNKTIADLLSSRPLPSFFIVSSVAANVGKTQSKGFELSLRTTNIVNRNFSWRTEFNFAHYKDTWKERDSLVVKTLARYIGINDPIRSIYGYVTNGIMQVGETAPAHMPGLQPGMVKVIDQNGYDANGNLTGKPDGRLNTADAIYLGNSDPGYSFGFGNSFEYKNFDLNIFMYGMLDRLKYNDDRASAYDLYAKMGSFGWNALDMVKDRWASDNTSGSNPSGLINPYGSYTGNYFREKAGFLKCRNITLGYTLPKQVLDKQQLIRGLRVFADVQNVFVISPYSGLDPELSGFIAYPAQRSFILGLNLGF